jgi:hypothetical protein
MAQLMQYPRRCHTKKEATTMGYLVDFFYLMKELFKLLLLVLISPLGLMAGYLFSWE